MSYKKSLLLSLILIAAVFPVCEAWAVDALAKARKEANDGKYEATLKDVDLQLAANPNDFDARVLQAQIYGWEKNFPLAETKFNELEAEEPQNADVWVARGYMYYAEGKLDNAKDSFAAALKLSPNYQEAKQGMLRVLKASDNPLQPYRWQADIGGELSTFARTPQTNWNNEFIQLGRNFNESGTAVHVGFMRYHQFERSDLYYELGADQRFTPYANGYFYGGIAPNPNFRPRWHVETGGSLRLFESAPKAVWLTLDTRYDDYPTTEVSNLNPGLRYEFADNWAISGTMISVLQTGAKASYGAQGKLDGQIKEGWRFYAGLANAPETVAGSTVITQTYFSGTAIDVNPANTLHFGYTRDDRENSYIRNAFNVSLTSRF